MMLSQLTTNLGAGREINTNQPCNVHPSSLEEQDDSTILELFLKLAEDVTHLKLTQSNNDGHPQTSENPFPHVVDRCCHNFFL